MHFGAGRQVFTKLWGEPKKDEPDDRAEWLMIHLTASISRRDDVFGRDRLG